MEFRKLQKNEHFKTRELWEEIFTEDSAQFLDYYYEVKTEENEIFVAEDNGTVRSMLQLNPYRLHLGDEVVEAKYIIAVATDEKYRHQGLMAALLKMSMGQMYDNGEPFTFLMPAAEAIYRPFDFRYIYAQKQTCIEAGDKKESPDRKGFWEDAKREDLKELAVFAEEMLRSKYTVYAVRDEHYYEVMLKEQQSENGGIRVLRYDGQIAGCFFYEVAENCAVREPLIRPGFEAEFEREVRAMSKGKKVLCLAGTEGKEKPMIMARILCLKSMIGRLRVSEKMEVSFGIDDPILSGNCGCYRLSASAGEKISVQKISSEDTCQPDIPVALLTEVLFGYKEPAVLQGITSPEVLEEIGKIIPASPVFLNEIV